MAKAKTKEPKEPTSPSGNRMQGDDEGLFSTKGESLKTVYMDSGNIALDMAISNGKGLPVGGYIILTAKQGAGKTTTFMDVARRKLRAWEEAGLDYKLIYLDLEGSNDLAVNSGFEYYRDTVGSVLYMKRDRMTFKTLETISRKILDGSYGDVKLLMIDSISLIMSDREVEREADGGNFGDAARGRSEWYRKWLAPLLKKGVTVLTVAQNRTKQNTTGYENPNKPAITNADLHHADAIISLSKSIDGKDTECKKREIKITTSGKTEKINDVFKVTYTAYSDKNRYGHYPAVTTLMKYGKGCANWYIMHEILKTYKHLKNTGSATYPKWNFDADIQTYVGTPAGEDLDKRAMQDYINQNMESIKDFLRERDQYRLVDYGAEEE